MNHCELKIMEKVTVARPQINLLLASFILELAGIVVEANDKNIIPLKNYGSIKNQECIPRFFVQTIL